MNYHLAQLNIAQMTVPYDHPIMADFVNNLDRINAVADQSDGFIWRYIEERDAGGPEVFDAQTLLVNMSVWKSMDALFQFTYQSEHVEIFKRRKEWFTAISGMHMVCWYISPDSLPTLSEAKLRLEHLNSKGETPFAFTFKGKFTVDDYKNYLDQQDLLT